MPNERIPRRQYESQVGKTRLKGLITKVLHILARNTPFPHLRVTLYRWMGIHIGRQVSIGLDSYLDDQFAMAMSFEDDCRLEARVTTVVHDDAGLSPAGPGSIFKQGPLTLGHVAPITIRRGAIIQARAALLPGIIVGERAIVRPGAVVTRDVPPCSVVAGAPAKVICSWQRDSHSQSPSPGADDEPSRSQPPSPGAPSRERDLEQADFSRQQERKEEPNMSLLPPNYILRAEYDAQVRKSWFRLAYQYLMLCLARFTLPTKLRVALYRAMGANVGRDVYIGVDTYLDERYPELITFEDDSGPSFRSIYVTHGETYDAEGTRIRYVAPIRVKRGAWSGSNTVVCPGVTIGEGAIVGSGSVITEDVPDYAVVVGNPAQVIKYRTPPQQEPAAESKRR